MIFVSLKPPCDFYLVLSIFLRDSIGSDFSSVSLLLSLYSFEISYSIDGTFLYFYILNIAVITWSDGLVGYFGWLLDSHFIIK